MRRVFRGLICLLSLVIYIAFMIFMLWIIGKHTVLLGDTIGIVHILYRAYGIYLVLTLIKNSSNFSYALPWIIIILLFPIVGPLLYVVLGKNKKSSLLFRNIAKSEKDSEKFFVKDEKISNEIDEKNLNNLKYIDKYSNFPITTNNDIDYYNFGEKAFPVMLEELKKAEKFIFFEYFIVAPGKMWNSILEILEEKAKNGVDVRVIYDDLGCLATVDGSYYKQLRSKGIKCITFNKLGLDAGVIMNHRDHRKILVIDGKVAFSGGINIADEYINVNSKYGVWKDNSIRIKGEAVWNYTVMFLQVWNAYKKDDDDFNKFKYNFSDKKEYKGYVVPYGENPFNKENIAENIYLNIISNAKKYIYIFTPYLIIDTDVLNNLILAAKRGVDVRIVIPGIPDKKLVYSVSESYAETLAKGGVKIYKYTPGFVHSKVFVCDDNVATVGTINMDYRSLYLHFECGCYMEDAKVVSDVKNDLIETMEKCHEVTESETKTNFFKGIFQACLRLIAPLM